jgi:preprotein translocase subunit SecG
MSVLLMILLILTSLFLILLILIQRGKGGGLAGAFGGLGGQSAFGTKAGDTFTRITIGVAALWILLCMATLWTVGSSSGPMDLGGPTNGLVPDASQDAPATGSSGSRSDEPGE